MTPYAAMAYRTHTVVRAMHHQRKLLLGAVQAVANASDEAFADAFGRLVPQIEANFAQEETLMESVGYAGLHAQRQDNALLLSALHHAESRVTAGELDLGRQVVATLPDLLSLHRFSGTLALTGTGLRKGRQRGRIAPPRPARHGHRGLSRYRPVG